MKKALENIRAAVVAGSLSIAAAAGECRKNGFSMDYPGGVYSLLHLPGIHEREKIYDCMLERAANIVKYYWSDTKIDKQIIFADDFCGVYAWAARECGTCLVRIGTADGLPDDAGIEFFRACCANWSGLDWHIVDATGYDAFMGFSGFGAASIAAIDRKISDMRELADIRAERAAALAAAAV